MDILFELFSSTGEASVSFLLVLMLEPLLYFLGFLTFVVCSFKHYRKTKCSGSLIVLVCLVMSAAISIVTELLMSTLDDITFSYVEVTGRIMEASLYLLMVYGVYVVYKQHTMLSIAIKSNVSES